MAALSGKGVTEILVVGNELLNGTTLDTNSHWLSLQLEKVGAIVSRKTTVRDDLNAISEEIKQALKREPEWLFTIGGLGPTYDDMTLQGVAKALGRTVVRNSTAVKYLKESYKRRPVPNRRRLSRSSLKMAEIPEGSTPLHNSAGSAPGVLIDTGRTKIISLPGVPREMKAIFSEQVLHKLRKYYGNQSARKQIWFNTVRVRESQIAPFVRAIMKKYSDGVYLKSHPMGFDPNGDSLLRFQLISTDSSEWSVHLLGLASRALSNKISKLGGKILSTRSIG